MPRRKPLGWPRYMVARRLKSSATAYYWAIPSWAKRNGCALEIEVLGTDYADAKKRCDELLNPQLDAWRKREQIVLPPITQCTVLLIGWLRSTSHRRFIGNCLQERANPMTRRYGSPVNTN
jgi:hypothetical protein